MKTWKLSIMVMAVMLVMTWAPVAFGAVSPEEAAKLGTTLTPVGAEMAGNRDGSIPAYTGGLTKPPASFKVGSGIYTDPYAGEKPLFSINAQNMNQYADKLSEGMKALMKRFPTFRIDVYKTHRTAAFPDYVLKNTAKNAVKATSTNRGMTVNGAWAGYPFPIPKDGYEAMWNHLLRYQGRAWDEKFGVFVVDANGSARLSQGTLLQSESPYYDENQQSVYDPDVFWKSRWHFILPTRLAGEKGMVTDYVDLYKKARVAYQYLPGQRRVKLAPEIGFDTPVPSQTGSNVYDDQRMYSGSMERYNMRLIGKKEVYVPYNTYKVSYQHKPMSEVMGPKHVNPDLVRWELHRVWVVEGTLKPGFRHAYKSRRFYLDEDSWNVVLTDMYDAHGNLYRLQYAFPVPMYDVPNPNSDMRAVYDMTTNNYCLDFWWGGIEGYRKAIKPLAAREWSPQAIAGGGIR